LLVEDSLMLAFEGLPKNAIWLTDEKVDSLLRLKPEGNVVPEQAPQQIKRILEDLSYVQDSINQRVIERGEILRQAHTRVRSASNLRGVKYSVEPVLPADVLGAYLFLPT
jgi:hypothetical protein